MATLPKQSTSNKPVKRAYKKRVATSKPGQNKNAIMTLSRQVKSLQNSKYGEVQRHAQYLSITGVRLPAPQAPLAFLLNDMYLGAQMFQGVAPVAGVPGFATSGVLTPYSFAADLLDQYEWNARQNLDTVSAVMYKPIFSRVNLQVQTSFPNGVSDLGYRLRLSIIKLKPYNASTAIDTALPTTLGAYRQLAAASTNPVKNNFNPSFHTIVYDKWVTVKPQNLDNEAQSIDLSIPFKFPENSVMRPDKNSNPPAQSTWTNVPVAQQYWLLISASNIATGQQDVPLTTMNRINMVVFQSWRDQHGTGASP